MKKIIYIYIFNFFLIENISLKAQEFPDFSFESSRTCVTNPPTSDDQRLYIDFFKGCQSVGKWRPISGSADLLLTRISNTTTGGFRIGAGVEYTPQIPSNPQPPCNYDGINHGEGLMYIGKQFLKGKKYFLTIEYQILDGWDGDNVLDYAGIKLSNSANDITAQCTGSDCTDGRPWFNSVNNFKSISGQEIKQLGGPVMATTSRIDFCFIPDANYSQMLFFVFNNGTPIDGSNNYTFGLKVSDIKLSCCDENKEYNGTDNIAYYPPTPNTALFSHLRLPELTEVKQNLTIFPRTGNIVIKNTEKVTLRAGKNIQFKAGINQKRFIIEQGANFKVELKPCSSCSINEDCTANYIPPNSPNHTAPFQHVYIPNVFDPNRTVQPSINFAFTPQTSTIYKKPYNAYYAKMEIFSRWGNRVFSRETSTCGDIKPEDISWNGCFNGYPSQPSDGPFVYYLKLENCYGSAILTGSVDIYAPSTLCGSGGGIASSDDETNSSLVNTFKSDDNNPNYTNHLKVLKNSENLHKTTIFVFPNPSRNNIFLTIYSKLQNSFDIDIIDITGRTIKYLGNRKNITGQLQEDIDISMLPNGMYFIEAKSSETKLILSQKFVKY